MLTGAGSGKQLRIEVLAVMVARWCFGGGTFNWAEPEQKSRIPNENRKAAREKQERFRTISVILAPYLSRRLPWGLANVSM